MCTVEEAMVCGKENAYEEQRRESGEERRLGNVKGLWCPVPELQGWLLDGNKGFGGKPQLERNWGGRYCAPLVQQSLCVGWPSETEYGEFKGVWTWEDMVEQGMPHVSCT